MIKRTTAFLCFIILLSCQNNKTPTDFSTVDSNTVEQGDSIPSLLHIDTGRTDAGIAMDSAGPTITASDTAYNKK